MVEILEFRQTDGRKLVLPLVWQKWWFSAPQTPLWLIKVWFSALIPKGIRDGENPHLRQARKR